MTGRRFEPGERVRGARLAALTDELVERYGNGESVRALARSTGRSYGFVHRTLTGAGVELRGRGWAGRVPVRDEGGRP